MEVAGDLIAEAGDGGRVGEIAGEDGGLAAGFLNLFADLVEAGGVTGDEEDVGVERGEAEGDGFADSASGAGDEGDLGIESRHISIFYAKAGGGEGTCGQSGIAGGAER